jgi:hypothetical protein
MNAYRIFIKKPDFCITEIGLSIVLTKTYLASVTGAAGAAGATGAACGAGA